MDDDRDFDTSFEELIPEKGVIRTIILSWTISLVILAGAIAALIWLTQWFLARIGI